MVVCAFPRAYGPAVNDDQWTKQAPFDYRRFAIGSNIDRFAIFVGNRILVVSRQEMG